MMKRQGKVMSKLARLAALGPLAALGGCQYDVLDPAGAVGLANRSVIVWATGLMLLVVVPVIALTLIFAWRYRASNLAADYAPNWSHSNKIEAVVWLVPALIVATLATICWRSTHELDPYRPLASAAAPVEVDVVSMDWKWLFIYPQYGVASVNELALPVGRPVNFKITSSAVMNSFFIPALGSQIYSMAGMQTQLHLIADKPGSYRGMSANFSGDGFADMHFQANAMAPKAFAAWVAHARTSRQALDRAGYAALLKPSEHVPPATYGSIDPKLFDAIVMQRLPAGPTPPTGLPVAPHPALHQD